VSIGADFNAQRNILRINTSARTNTLAPPVSYRRAGPMQPNITLPYSSVVTAMAYTNCILTRLLCKPSRREWHLILLKAAFAFYILFSNIVLGLFLALSIIRPKYLNCATFSIFYLLHLKTTSIFIYIAFVLVTFIYNPFKLQNISKAVNICYKPSALCDTRTASSAKARKNIYKVAISNMYRLIGVILLSSKYYNKYGYT
jgi:hypothetical protein